MSDETTISNEETTTTIVDAQQPRTATRQAEIDYQQQGFTPALVDYDRERCVYREIEERAEVSPRKAAIAYRGRELSYGGLNAQANQVARYLVRMGVGKGDLVGVFMRRTPQMVAVMLGVWKAGAGYVPLDPQYPPERLRFMLQDAASKLVITTNSVRDRVGEIRSRILYLDEEREQIEEESPENLDEVLSSGQVAYVIYTAGSTGAPKGVMLAHQSVMSLVTWAKSAFQPEELEGVLAAASIGSDLSIFELWATLSCGGTVVLADDLMDWWEHIDDEDAHPVRLINTRPSAMTKLMQQGSLPKSARTVNLTGEVLNTGLVGQLTKAGDLKQVNNLYGQSETTTYSTWTTVGAGDKVTIGRAVANTQLYVLDEEMQLVPGGVAGELYVGGDGLALGYLKNFRLTAERFLPNPFSQGNGSRMYRTGDVVRWQEDGQLEYLSRADQQVRLGGYRIKLEEIEAAVLDHAGVSQAVVVARVDQTGVKRLMGYVVGRGKKIDVGRLRGYLQQRLPEYMVPSAFQQLDSLPLTPNGKIDRKALAELESGEAIEETSAPVLTPTEELITGVWSSLLGKSNIGRDDNFFGLGGHSLLVTQVISRIREVFQVELPLQVMFESPTVAGLARSIESSTRIEAPPLRRRSRQERIPLSFGQERLRFLSRYELETSLYNVPVAVRLRGALNVEAAKASLQEMVHRHEALRTSFPEVGDSTIQDIAAEMEVPFAVAEIREDELDEVLREQARRSFDLSHGPLIRASLFRIGSQDHVLLVVTHHIVSDGWSLGVMLREFNALYDSFSRGAASPLPPLPIQYADYSEWQREWLQGEVLEKQLDYWRKQLAGHETLRLPTDRPHSAKPTLAGTMETSRLPESLVSQLKLLSDQQGVTLFMTLLAGFEILLYRYTGQTDISVGSGIANRNRQELEPLIGFFVNTLVLRTRFTEDSSVAELLQRVREVSLQAYAHQDIPFERLVEALDPVRELSRTPFFQALFVLQNAPLPTVSWDGLEATASIVETGTAKFDLTLSAREEDGELELSLEYRTELFNAERMKRLLQHYGTLLEGIAVSVDARIGELEILSEPERQQLLVEWKRTEAPYSTNQCVHQLFEEQAAKTPQAVVDGDRQISYEELNRRANQLAHYLARLGVGPEVRVGICMERGLEMMAGVLGVLKAGGAYVPLDPADPSARRSCMVKDAGAKFVLTNERFTQQMAGCAEHVVDLEEAREEIEKQSGDNLKVHLDAENLAWVIYTSSSAGRPRGTAIPHCSAVSMLQRTLIDAMDQNPSVERWLNLYGLAEDTTYATYAEVKLDEQGAVTIGRSLSNPQAYVLDGHMKLVPVGIKGELYMSGSGQARGYLNRPELTAEKFVPNPFGKTGGERLYRTGDLVRYQENGNLEFLGRLDSQVKIQGRRIEPGEIEAALFDYPGVTQAAVIAREDEPGNVRLVGYVASSERLDVDRLRSHLQQRVPEYMVPAALLQLDTLPLTASGKVDRKALIELKSKEAMEDAGSLTLTPTEELIAGVWSGLLGKSDIRRDDNFFDLGGHSLMVTQMVSRLRQVFHREIELRAMFESPVLKDLSAYVDRLTGPAQQATDRPIVPASRDGDLPLSLQQEQLWFLEQITAGSTVYSLPDAVRLKGDLDKLALRLSLEEIVRRHEILRTSFVQVDGKPKQRIHETGNFELVERDLRETANGVAPEERINREQKEEAASPFLLSQPNLFRAKLLRVAEQEHILLLTFHHIVFDGWSIGVMVNELGQLYKAYHEGQSSPLPELPVQYADYSVWQREVMAEGEFVDGLEYWKKELEDLSELDLPSDHPRPAVQSFRGTVERWEMSPEASAAIRKVSQDQGVTLFMTLLAGFQILLARYSGQRDIVVGSPIANRMQPELEALIGFFVNTLVLRGNVNSDLTVEAVLQRTREVCLGAYAHQSVPFEHLVDELRPERDLSRSPLFQAMLVLQNAPAGALQMHGVEISMLPSATSGARFDLTLLVEDNPEHLQGMMEYCTDLYEPPTVRRMLDHYQQVLSEMVRDPKQSVSTLPLLTEAERHRLLFDWNDTETVFASGCIHELFAEQVEKTPNAVAVECEGREISYAELNRRANQLGHYLRRFGIGSEELVGILLPRSTELLVAMLGVLKAGGACLLLSPDDQDRLSHVLNEAKPSVVLSQQHLNHRLTTYAGKLIQLDEESDKVSEESAHNVDARVHPETLAYVRYDSEVTDALQSVAIQHGALVNLLRWVQSVFSAADLAKVLTSNPPTSELSILDMYLPLCCGGTVIVVDGSLEEVDVTENYGITLISSAPSAMRELIRRKTMSSSVRTIILTGEPVPPGLVSKIYDNCDVKRVFNLYGHSEAAFGSTVAELQPQTEDTRILIGKPVGNTQVFVLDAQMELMPVGTVGELYVAGPSLARGYFNQPDLTAERFLPNPFSGAGGRQLYRTGELARYKANGEIELWGRVGHETRIRGHRIDLEEIERTLERQPEVADAVVVVQPTDTDANQLVAYIVPHSLEAAKGNALERMLRVALKQRLPEYMVPSHWATLERLPLLPDGKLDRSALPAVQPKSDLKQSASLPASDTERTVTAIWKQILKIEEVGVEDNFFDVGGQSLLIPEVHGALHKQFGTSLTIVELFQYSTIRALADRLDAEKAPAQEVAPAIRGEVIETEQPKIATKGFAVIGMACRFPGARNIDEFWNNLRAGVESTVDFSDEELRAVGIGEELLASPHYVKRGSVVANADLFDARFFDISGREAELIDPQQRVFLECAWEALEDAGYTSETYKGRIGVYAGSGPPTYLLNLQIDHKKMDFSDATAMLFANANDFIATRAAYKLNLTGPSMTVQTACSTSLVAVHLACRALLNHECDLAMAGGVTIRTPQVMGDVFVEGGIVSPDGHTRTFDERAQGVVRANGAGIVVLKRLEDAIRDRDCIHAVVRGSAVNNDGSQKAGYTAPSVIGQREVIQQALRDSGVEPETISYVEAHGTATPLGDPIEMTALMQAFRVSTGKNAFCAVGSVKSNIGHTDCAAGVSGLIKTVLALEHKQIPATLHFERPNPKIDFAHSPFYVNAALSEWKTDSGPRRAGVNSFGIGGTNAHVIVEEAPADDSISVCRPWQLVLLSAKTATAMEAAAGNLEAHLQKNDSVSLPDVAHTLQVGRAAFTHRCFVVAESVADATEALKVRHIKSLTSSVVANESCRLAFLFPGQGSQYVNMGKQLYAHEPLFRELVDQCSELLQPSLQLDLRSVLYPSSEEYQWAEAELRETRTTQPALFVVEYALARMWMSWGLLPESMLGHSVGEYVAACLAGVFSLEDALNLVAIRGRLMQSCMHGGMLAVAASEEEVQRYLKMGLELAAINGSRSCVLTGPLDSLELAEKELVQQQLVHRRLQSSHAFHSAMMEPIIGQFTEEVQKVRLNAPRTRYLSNLTGDWITAEQATDPGCWGKQLRGTVQFAKGIQKLCDESGRLTLEVGPGHTNSTAIRQTIAKEAVPVMLTSLPDSHEESDVKHVLTVLGNSWLHGARVDWNAFASGEKRKRLPLPTYPFERQRYWVEAQASRGSRPDTSRRKLSDWLYLPCWKETARVPSGSEANVSENTTVLMFSDNSRMAQKLALRLEQKRYNIVTVIAGQEFAKIDHWIYTIRPAARTDYDALFSTMRAEGQFPAKIVHLWNVSQNESVEQDLDFALYSPLHLVQAATAEPGSGPIQCMIVSSGLHGITGNESLSPAKATLLGLCKTIPWELPDFACKSVDIEVPAKGSWIERSLLDQLVAELESKEQQPVVSYRGPSRWIQTFDQIPLEAGGPELVRESGVYLITGGLNDVGFQFAEWLASDAHAAIVLVDSRPFPSREHWDIWPVTHVGDPAVTQINRIRAWEQSGAKVLISDTDVADRHQMGELRHQVQEAWGKIDGVIHAADFSEAGPIASQTRDQIGAVLRPKVPGAVVLDEIFAGEDLDFMVFCSSLISVVGEAEQAACAAANAFLDSLARRNFFRNRCFTLSINWDVWDWEAPDKGTSPAGESTHAGIKPEEAVEVLRRLLRAKPGPQAIISTRDLAALARPKNVDTAEEAASATGRVYARTNLDRPIDPPTNATEALLVPIWTEVLGVSPIGIRDDFFDLGGDSLIGLRMTSRLQDLGIHVSIEQLFRHRTVQELAVDIEEGKLAPADATSAQSSARSELQTAPIRRVDRDGKLALSYGQERLWFINLLEPENVSYNMPDSVRIAGPLDTETLARTVQEVVRRHESLRTRFLSVNGEPQQIIDASIAVELPLTDLSHLPESDRESEARRLALEEARQPFDLARGPLFRVKLLRLASQDHVLVFNMHHIVSDAWSVGVLVREVSAIYNNFSTGQPSSLPELDIQYADFSAWQRELLNGPLFEEQLEYWKRKLAAVEPLMLPTDRPRTALQRPEGATTHFTVPVELTEALKTLSRKQGATLYMILLAAFQALLSRYSGQSDITVGSPIAGRSRTETEGLIGVFINTLVLRSDLSGQPDSIDLLQRVKATTLEAFANQDVPFEKLVEVLLPQRDLTRTPLFQVLFVLQNVPRTALELGTAKMLPFEIDTGAAQFEISLILAETGSGMEGLVEYNIGLFEAATVTRMIGHYQMLLSGIVANPSQSIAVLPLLTAKERKQVIEEWNRTEAQYPQEKCVHELFEEQVARTPQAVAVVDEDGQLSYGELNQRANQIAHYLRKLGVGPDVVVGLCIEPSVEMVMGVLGVLKAGGAYVPLDPEYPAERLAYMMQDAQLNFLLTQELLRDMFAGFTGHVICVDPHHLEKVLEENDANPDGPDVDAENLAYVLYTSGSTGKPKGVGMTQGPLCNLVRWQLMSSPGPKRTLQFSPLTFDLSFYAIFATLCSGGSLVLIDKDTRRDPSELWKVVCEREVEKLFLPFIALQGLAEVASVAEWESTSLREVITTAEQLKVTSALRRFFDRLSAAILDNEYGPTETHVVTAHRLPANSKEWPLLPPIGKPITNDQVYVLDDNCTPLPIGIPGGLYLAGVGLARGYLNRPDMTAERFLPNPFSVRGGERMYRTGDLTRWLPDGNLEFLGRLDHQVKIRGFRIELGEIEAALQEHAGVRQAVVIAQEDETGEKRLVAYVVPERESEESTNGSGRVELQITELREHLLGKLPEYMVPTAYVQLEALPLNHNGKIDRKNLPQPDTATPKEEYVGPRNPTEETLCRLWQEVLRQEHVGIHDNFFKIGGHSLLAARVSTRMRENFKVDIPLRRMFELPTIAQLAGFIDQTVQSNGANGAPSQCRPAIKRVARKAALVEVD